MVPAAVPTACASTSLLWLVALVGVGARSSRMVAQTLPLRPLVVDPVAALVAVAARAVLGEVGLAVVRAGVVGDAALLGIEWGHLFKRVVSAQHDLTR